MEFPELPPAFDGDDFHELRGLQHALRKTVIANWATEARDRFRSAWIVAGKPLDPLARELFREGRILYISCLEPPYAWLSAFWRLRFGHIQPAFQTMMPVELLTYDYQRWLLGLLDYWIIWNPQLLRLMCKVVATPLVEAETDDMLRFAEQIRLAYPWREDWTEEYAMA